MQCPYCGHDDDKVVDSRSAEGGQTVRRRRECNNCRRRFTTYERPEETIRLRVIKKDGASVSYQRDKVISGLQRACYKRPVTDDQIRKIVDAAEEEIFRRYEREVPSSFIGDVVGERLKEVDKVAYVRFASVYRQFADVGELIDEAREVKDAPVPGPGQKDLFEQE